MSNISIPRFITFLRVWHIKLKGGMHKETCGPSSVVGHSLPRWLVPPVCACAGEVDVTLMMPKDLFGVFPVFDIPCEKV